MLPESVLRHIDDNMERYVDELMQFIAIPSDSMTAFHAKDVREAAEWTLKHVSRLGFTGRIYETPGHPVVYAELLSDPDAPTLLIYGHYDVQPEGDPEDWESPPFSPEVRNEMIFGRGASDDKGQLFTYIKSIESILAAEGRLPANIKLFFEGEEELGSPNMDAFVGQHKELLKADVIAISDGAKFTRDRPAIEYGLRGLVYMQIDVEGPEMDIHSGVYGGGVTNPATALIQILSKLRDDSGKVLIPGFYDDVREIEAWERKQLASLPFDASSIKSLLGLKTLNPEQGYTFLESTWTRPTMEINGIWGGYQGEGSKTIIPASAGAKVSMRIVPDQSMDRIIQLFEAHVRSVTPPGVTVKITRHAASEPVIVSQGSAAIRSAKAAIEYAFDREPVFIRSGGSIGVVLIMKKWLGIEDILLIGFADPEDGEHSPNEHFSLDNYYRGIKTTGALIYGLAQTKKPEEVAPIAEQQHSHQHNPSSQT
ncbi:MAG TPA: dipeptidase [Methanocella sp.]|nr:dipeptidase [Methanocella sp.]